MSYSYILNEEYLKKIEGEKEDNTPILDSNAIDNNFDDAFLYF